MAKIFGELPLVSINSKRYQRNLYVGKTILTFFTPPALFYVNHHTKPRRSRHHHKRQSVVHHSLNSPLQSSLTQHLPDKSVCQVLARSATSLPQTTIYCHPTWLTSYVSADAKFPSTISWQLDPWWPTKHARHHYPPVRCQWCCVKG